jgi:hypothetical protein
MGVVMSDQLTPPLPPSPDEAWPSRESLATRPPESLPPGTTLDPAAVSGPPWPRLVAAEGTHTAPKLIRWPIVVGIVLFLGCFAASAALRPRLTAAGLGSASPYELTATDAHFTATFPARPERTTRQLDAVTVIVYVAGSATGGVSVTYVHLPASARFSLNGAVRGAAASIPGGQVISHSSLTYRGQPAEDATISAQRGVAQILVVRFGPSAYVVDGFGVTTASFAPDYRVLLDSFSRS